MRSLISILALGTLTACMTPAPEQMTFANLSAETRRDYREAMFEEPFSEGAISVLVSENGTLHTYGLTPCSQQVCSSTGRPGTLARTADYWVVSGAYPGRSFYLAPGGDGYMLKSGVFLHLAWD